MGRAMKLRKTQRGAQFEAARFLRLCHSDRGLQRLLGRRGIGRVALQQDVGADAVHLRFVPALLGAPTFGERVVQALEPSSDLAGTCFGFGQGRFETRREPNKTLLPNDVEAASHLSESRPFGSIGPLCQALQKYRQADPKSWKIIS